MTKKFASAIQPITKVMLSSSVGTDAALEELHKDASWKILKSRFTLDRSNGSEAFGLTDLEQKIVKPYDGFVFLPIPKEIKQLHTPERREFFREMFKAASLFVGVQTKDPNLRLNPQHDESPLKPIILVNHEGCYEPFRELVNHMHELGTITQKPDSIVKFVRNIDEAIALLKTAHEEKILPQPHHDSGHKISRVEDIPISSTGKERPKPEFNVCVFCSASTKNKELISMSETLGEEIAKQGWGLISGLGKTGMMGGVVRGAAKVVKEVGKGWVGGSNLPRIIAMEGLPEYYDRMWAKEDIYTRMQVMIENSQAFMIMPGGMGTVQELMALLLLKHAHDGDKDYIMSDAAFANKPIIVVNKELTLPNGEKTQFWKPLIEMAEKFGFYNAAQNTGDIIVVASVEEAMEKLQAWHTKKANKIAARTQDSGGLTAR
ncbi:MAG: LOG family protein [Alphaproteobacteria bacterium]